MFDENKHGGLKVFHITIKKYLYEKIFTLFSMLSAVSIFCCIRIFIKLNNNGNYTVSLNNQSITSTSTIFRFLIYIAELIRSPYMRMDIMDDCYLPNR